MPYKSTSELPDKLKKHLPKAAQTIYMEAFNSAWKMYADPKKRRDHETREVTAHKVAWNAVKKQYRKDEATGDWKKI